VFDNVIGKYGKRTQAQALIRPSDFAPIHGNSPNVVNLVVTLLFDVTPTNSSVADQVCESGDFIVAARTISRGRADRRNSLVTALMLLIFVIS